jgi:hypothetical protein
MFNVALLTPVCDIILRILNLGSNSDHILYLGAELAQLNGLNMPMNHI